MPQMMPLNWFLLFLMFSMLMIMFNMINYFSMFHLKKNKITLKPSFNTLYWKW
uniref:ATP synthase F0 subunit 8 n=1 Tax=Caliris sp. JZ-2017 TaxID=2073104 RepID=A0A343UMX2_9NEOP|nr:ATP synthase F0 subunit 8 [Caliris sp. JZ-2017]